MATISLHEAARRLGVHYMTAYRYVRTGRLPAGYASGRWQIDEADLARFAPGPLAAARRGEPDWVSTRARMLTTLLGGDEAGAWAVAETCLAAGAQPAQIYVQVLAPCLGEVGDLWERSAIGVADEHRATVVATRLVGRLGSRLRPRGRRSGTVVVAGVAGDHHALPAAMLADLLRSRGLRVVDLGANAPIESILRAVDGAGHVDAVCLSVATRERFARARRTARALRARCPGTTVLVGGPAVVTAEDAEAVGSDEFLTDGLQAASAIRRRIALARARSGPVPRAGAA